MGDFDPRKRVSISLKDIERARFWYEVKLYLKVLAIVGIPWSLLMWAMLNWL